jgi:acyl-CoA hydrolase
MDFEKKTHCIIVFVSVDKEGKPTPVKKWQPQSDREKALEAYAIRLKALRKEISDEMEPFLFLDEE